MSKLNAIIIEDFTPARLDLMAMLKEYCPQVKVDSWAENATEAMALLEQKQPDILFLDLTLKGIQIMELLQRGSLKTTSVIIVSGDQRLTADLVRPETVAFLGKPVNPTELIKAVTEAEAHQKRVRKSAQPFRLKVANKHGQHLLELAHIRKLIAKDNRTLIYTDLEETPLETSKTLKTFDFLDENHGFCRIHHSHLINLRHVRSYHLIDGGRVILSDGSSLSISRSNLDKFLKRIEAYSLDE